MATVVLLVDECKADLVVTPDTARSLARLGVTSFSIVRDRRTLGVVLEGWAFDPSASSPAAAGALFGDRSAVRVLGPVARVAVEPASEIAS